MDIYITFAFFLLISASSQTDEEHKEAKKFKVLPKIVFFDLDYTLWPYMVEIDAFYPFHKNETTQEVIDNKGKVIKYYPEVPQVFNYLKSLNIDLAVCSSTIAIQESKKLIDIFGWKKLFKIEEIYPINKASHLEKMKAKYGINLLDVLFFDDEPYIHIKLRHINVVSELVEYGMDMEVLMEGLKKYSDIRSDKVLSKNFDNFKHTPKFGFTF